jgi:hypothetical protein
VPTLTSYKFLKHDCSDDVEEDDAGLDDTSTVASIADFELYTKDGEVESTYTYDELFPGTDDDGFDQDDKTAGQSSYLVTFTWQEFLNQFESRAAFLLWFVFNFNSFFTDSGNTKIYVKH